VPKKTVFNGNDFEVDDNIYIDYKLRAITAYREEDFHGKHLIDESTIDFTILKMWTFIYDEIYSLNPANLTEKQLDRMLQRVLKVHEE
jgi:hypothetical protein